MADEQSHGTSWWLTIFALVLATSFIYFLVFNAQEASHWLQQNLRLAWYLLAGVLACLGGFFIWRVRTDRAAAADRIRGPLYLLISVSIFLVLLMK